MLVREVMTTPVVTVRPEATLKAAIESLDRHQVTALPVVDEHRRLVGVVSEADVIRDAVLPDRRAHETTVRATTSPVSLHVSDVMTGLPVSVGPDDDLAGAVMLLVDTQIKSLPVVEHERVVWKVSRRDVIAVLSPPRCPGRGGGRRPAPQRRGRLRGRGRRRRCTPEQHQRTSRPRDRRVLAACVPGVVAVVFDS
jgi:CBS domain-containing protein